MVTNRTIHSVFQIARSRRESGLFVWAHAHYRSTSSGYVYCTMSVSSSRCVVDYSPSDESEDDGRFTGGGADEEMREPVAKRMKTHEDSSLRM